MFIRREGVALESRMRISENPKLVLAALTAVFVALFALSLLTLGYSGAHPAVLQENQPPSGYHVIYFHFVYSGTNVTGSSYSSQPFVYHE